MIISLCFVWRKCYFLCCFDLFSLVNGISKIQPVFKDSKLCTRHITQSQLIENYLQAIKLV